MVKKKIHSQYVNMTGLREICHISSLRRRYSGGSHNYCARTASVYRRAIDAVCSGAEITPNLFAELESLAHRGYTDGFLARHPIGEYQNYDYGYSISDQSQFVGEVTETKNVMIF